jgi:dynein heavy chain
LREILEQSKQTADGWDLGDVYKPRHIWLEDYNAQISLLATQIIWTEETIRQFDDMDGGSENAMKDYLVLIKKRIDELIKRVRHPLSKELRVKIITIITIDVHERDVIKMFVEKKIADQGHFKWQCQLKFYLEDKIKIGSEEKRICTSKICDWTTKYNYEYVGNCGRLVITPLTDRCYITLT